MQTNQSSATEIIPYSIACLTTFVPCPDCPETEEQAREIAIKYGLTEYLWRDKDIHWRKRVDQEQGYIGYARHADEYWHGLVRAARANG